MVGVVDDVDLVSEFFYLFDAVLLDWAEVAVWGFEFYEGVAAVWEDDESVGDAAEGVGEFEADASLVLDGLAECFFDLFFLHV